MRAPIAAARSVAARRSLAAMVIDTAVSATHRSPRTSCATRKSSVESTPPEKQTSAEPYPPITSRRRACFSASAPVKAPGPGDCDEAADGMGERRSISGDRDPFAGGHRRGHLGRDIQLGFGLGGVLDPRAGGG